jgi:predicted HTH domain antitoxin
LIGLEILASIYQLCLSLSYHTIYSMTTLILQVPDSLEKDHDDTVRFLAAKLYESGKLSLGQAAEMAEMTKTTFADVLAAYDVSYINYSFEDVMADVARISK